MQERVRSLFPATPPGSRQTFTVAELGERIRDLLESGLEPVWVVGEVSNFKVHASGHCYFTLKDENAQIAAVLWKSQAQRLPLRPSDGLEVLVRGRVRFWPPNGRLQLAVDSLEPRGEGALRRELERRRALLAAEGLLDPARKRPLPRLPRTVGIVTALGGAALQDILRVLGERFPILRVVVRPVRVQGLGAELEIAAGLRDLETLPDLDVVIVGRGGGSIEDLWAFNDEGVARAIAACRVPVVSAVGHEMDVTLADLVADARAATPTAAAAMVVPLRAEIVEALAERQRSLVSIISRRLGDARRQLAALQARLRDPRRVLAALRVRAVELDARMARALRHRTALERERLGGLGASLSSLSPLAVLERGYSVAWKEGSEKPLRSAAEVAPDDRLRIRLWRGRVTARVTATEPDDGESH